MPTMIMRRSKEEAAPQHIWHARGGGAEAGAVAALAHTSSSNARSCFAAPRLHLVFVTEEDHVSCREATVLVICSLVESVALPSQQTQPKRREQHVALGTMRSLVVC